MSSIKKKVYSLLFIFLLHIAHPLPADAQTISPFSLYGFGMFPELFVYPRHAGKPDPRWRAFDWKYLDHDAKFANYRLYFYESERWATSLVVPRITEQINQLSGIFNHVPSERFDYVLFTSLQDFHQANIFFISEGVQGITSTEDVSMAVPYTGDLDFFNHVSKHELVHQIQIQKMRDIAGSEADIILSYIPLWFIEGMAEYYSLDGMDRESEFYIRDLLLYPDKKQGYVLPKLFETGPFNFIGIYKVGQAKIDFFESEFGTGTVQKIYAATMKTTEVVPDPSLFFQDSVTKVVGKSPDLLEQMWQKYLERYRTQAANLSQSLDGFQKVNAAGQNLDHFAISPDGRFIATREIDPLTGITYIYLIDRNDGDRKIEVAHDFESDLTSLFFMQVPNLALSNDHIAYTLQSPPGVEVEFRPIKRENDGIQLGSRERIPLYKHGLLQVSSPALSPDSQRLAFVGLSPEGWQNIYLIDFRRNSENIKQLTEGYYSWQNISWEPPPEGSSESKRLLASSNRTVSGTNSIFSIDTDSGESRQLLAADYDQLAPEGTSNNFVFQSWQSGSSQIHLVRAGQELRLTDAKTMMSNPVFRNDQLYALGFQGGRYQLYEVPGKSLLTKYVKATPDPASFTASEPWKPTLAVINDEHIKEYRPFASSGTRLDELTAFFATGSVGGLIVSASDLMRNYRITAQVISPDNASYANVNLFFTSQRGRSTWSAGVYRAVNPQLERMTVPDGELSTLFINDELGASATWQYPLGVFSYFDIGSRLGWVSRRSFENGDLFPEGDGGQTLSSDFVVAPTVRLGYDKIIYETYTGPLKGYSLLLESETNVYPGENTTNQRFRGDAAYYLQMRGRMLLALQVLAGTSTGGFNEPFLISSDDILRAYVFGDTRLLGDYMAAAKAELRFPLGTLFGFPPLRGLAAFDYGTVTDDWSMAEDDISSSYSLGLTLNLPPVGLNFIFSYPVETASGPEIYSPVLHFTLRYLYY